MMALVLLVLSSGSLLVALSGLFLFFLVYAERKAMRDSDQALQRFHARMLRAELEYEVWNSEQRFHCFAELQRKLSSLQWEEEHLEEREIIPEAREAFRCFLESSGGQKEYLDCLLTALYPVLKRRTRARHFTLASCPATKLPWTGVPPFTFAFQGERCERFQRALLSHLRALSFAPSKAVFVRHSSNEDLLSMCQFGVESSLVFKILFQYEDKPPRALFLFCGYETGREPSPRERGWLERFCESIQEESFRESRVRMFRRCLKEKDEAQVHYDEGVSYLSHDLRSALARMDLLFDVHRQSSGDFDDVLVLLQEDCRYVSRLVASSLLPMSERKERAKGMPVCILEKTLFAEWKALIPILHDRGLHCHFESHISEQYRTKVPELCLRRILGNLLQNALRYTKSGEVSCELVEEAHGIACRVKDSGDGIPEELQQRIFQPAFRVEKDKQGEGNGLASTRLLAEVSGLEVNLVKSGDEGSIFELLIPWSLVKGFEPNKAESDLKEAEDARLLLVDDDTSFCASVKRILGRQNYFVESLPSAKEARRALREGSRYSAIILDFCISDSEELKFLVQDCPAETSLAFLTGMSEERVGRQLEQWGEGKREIPVFGKPIDWESFRRWLDECSSKRVHDKDAKAILAA